MPGDTAAVARRGARPRQALPMPGFGDPELRSSGPWEQGGTDTGIHYHGSMGFTHTRVCEIHIYIPRSNPGLSKLLWPAGAPIPDP